MREPLEDIRITAENNRILALVENPAWSTFVRIVDEDLKRLDNISSLVVENRNHEELAQEMLVRYHTILKVREYINEMYERAELALKETQQENPEYIKIHNIEPHHL